MADGEAGHATEASATLVADLPRGERFVLGHLPIINSFALPRAYAVSPPPSSRAPPAIILRRRLYVDVAQQLLHGHKVGCAITDIASDSGSNSMRHGD